MANYNYATDTIRPVAGFSYLPISLEARGLIKPIPPLPGIRNGNGELVQAGCEAFEWTWPDWTQTELNFWKTLLGYDDLGPYSKRFSNDDVTEMPAARLWNRGMDLITYRLAVIDFPTWERYENGLYWSPMVRFSMLTQW
jgi:hypothetical protein